MWFDLSIRTIHHSTWLEDIIVHMVPIDCAVYDLFYGPETWLQRSFCYFCCDSLTTSTSDDHTDKDDSTTSKQRKSNFLNPKGFPKKVLKDSLRTFQKEKIFALLLLTGLLKAPNSPLFPPGEYAKRCYIEPQQQPQLATLEAYGSLTQKPRP